MKLDSLGRKRVELDHVLGEVEHAFTVADRAMAVLQVRAALQTFKWGSRAGPRAGRGFTVAGRAMAVLQVWRRPRQSYLSSEPFLRKRQQQQPRHSAAAHPPLWLTLLPFRSVLLRPTLLLQDSDFVLMAKPVYRKIQVRQAQTQGSV